MSDAHSNSMKDAFEAKYKRDWDDPSGDDIKAIWEDAWLASQSASELILDSEPVNIAVAIKRLQKYITRRQSSRGLDKNIVHTFDAGDSQESSLMLSDIETLIAKFNV